METKRKVKSVSNSRFDEFDVETIKDQFVSLYIDQLLERLNRETPKGMMPGGLPRFTVEYFFRDMSHCLFTTQPEDDTKIKTALVVGKPCSGEYFANIELIVGDVADYDLLIRKTVKINMRRGLSFLTVVCEDNPVILKIFEDNGFDKRVSFRNYFSPGIRGILMEVLLDEENLVDYF